MFLSHAPKITRRSVVYERPTPSPVFTSRALRFDELLAIHLFLLRCTKFILHSSFIIPPSLSRHGQFIKDFLDDRFAGFFLGLGFVGGHGSAIPKSRQIFRARKWLTSVWRGTAERRFSADFPANGLRLHGRAGTLPARWRLSSRRFTPESRPPRNHSARRCTHPRG